MLSKYESKPTFGHRLWDAIKRLLCLLLPICFAFGGYFLSPYIWPLFNSASAVPEWFRFVCAIILFLLPTSIICAETRKLNPIIKITVKNKESSKNEDSLNQNK